MISATCKSILYIVCTIILCLPGMSATKTGSADLALKSFAAATDQVLVLYNSDWKNQSSGSSAQDSREVAEYYASMHTDPETGKKPHLLGLSCKHFGRSHLNSWYIKEESRDNLNGIVFVGKGKTPSDSKWIRDSRKVEFHVNDPDADWNTVLIKCRSEESGQETIITSIRQDLLVSGLPANTGDSASYPPVEQGKGRCFRINAAQLFRGSITVEFSIKNRQGKTIRDLSLRYHDARDFTFSANGNDEIPDDKITTEDILDPVRKFLEDPLNALPDGTLLRDHILYIVVVHGTPYAVQGVFGIEHGATPHRSDHGSLVSLEQRLQTIYYDWHNIPPAVVPFYMAGGPEADKGVINFIITSALRKPLMEWNPYMHPDTYAYLRKSRYTPTFQLLPPFGEQRKTTPKRFFAYAVSRIDGEGPEEAKRLVDYALYASRYLRPEIDCRFRQTLAAQGKKSITTGDLRVRLQQAAEKNLWSAEELKALGFLLPAKNDQGLPFLSRPSAEFAGSCSNGPADWHVEGFYPGGVERTVTSPNGLNFKEANVWQQVAKGVTITAAGAPAYAGGPHITNATFGDYAILMKYLLRGRDLGECFLRATSYVNWSTSLFGDPLYHPDLNYTIIDQTPPRADQPPEIRFETNTQGVTLHAASKLIDSPEEPEVALLRVTVRDKSGTEQVSTSSLYSRRPELTMTGLKPDTTYTVRTELADPYGNLTTYAPEIIHTPTISHSLELFKQFIDKARKQM
ncbi:MAG: hypothetical protein WCP20_21310 [Desulfuromonadales bacterium]